MRRLLVDFREDYIYFLNEKPPPLSTPSVITFIASELTNSSNSNDFSLVRLVRILQFKPADEEVISLGFESQTKHFSLFREKCFLTPLPDASIYNLQMASFIYILVFILGLVVVVLTVSSAISTFVLPRSTRSFLNYSVLRLLRKVFNFIFHFVKTYQRRDAIMAYYAPIGLMMLLPVWYLLIALGYAAMYWALGVGTFISALQLSGSSLFTLGFAPPHGSWMSGLALSEAMLGLIMVALLIAYLPTMYAAFSRREQAVNMLEVRAGSPPSALQMLLRFNRIQGLEQLADYWRTWEGWFADIEESHSTLAALVFFRSPRSEASWVTAAGTVLDAASFDPFCGGRAL